MSHYGPDEPAATIDIERNFLAGDFVCGVGYGIQVVLYTSCVTYLWGQRKMRKNALLILGYITVLLCVETAFEIVQARTVQLVYIDNRNYPGGPWQFFLASQTMAVNVIFYATLFVLTFLSDLLVLWRCWVIWSATGTTAAYLVTLFPAMMLLASFAMGTLWTLQSSRPGLSLYSRLPMAFGTSYYAISLGVNIILTLLIMIRLFLYRRNLLQVMSGDHAQHYVSIATIIVESAALYSLFAILFLITYAVNNPTNQIFLGIATSTQQIAGYLIIYRLAEGRAWRKETLGRPMTSMGFQSGHTQAATATSGWMSGSDEDKMNVGLAGRSQDDVEKGAQTP